MTETLRGLEKLSRWLEEQMEPKGTDIQTEHGVGRLTGFSECYAKAQALLAEEKSRMFLKSLRKN